MFCPNIDTSIEENGYMKPAFYDEYRFWNRKNADGVYENVQFCKKIGRKKDVFECMNEREYKACRAYSPKDEVD